MPNHCTFSVSINTQSMSISCIDPTSTHCHTVQWFSDHIIARINVVCSCGSNMKKWRLLVRNWWRSVVVIGFQCRRCGRWMLEIIFSYIWWTSLWIIRCSIWWLIWLTFRFVVVTAINITWNETTNGCILTSVRAFSKWNYLPSLLFVLVMKCSFLISFLGLLRL